MTDIVERLEWFHEHGMCSDFKLIWDARVEIERLAADREQYNGWAEEIKPGIDALRADNERLRAALQALHDWNVEYARINNLFNADGSPATFHELLEARRALEQKPCGQ
jgi:hypothetical protein